MQRSHGSRRAALAAALALAWIGFAAPASAESAREQALREASEPGAFCTFACRPRSTSGWSAAAFGGVVLAMGIWARREDRL